MKRVLGMVVTSLMAVNAWAVDYKIDPSHSSVGFKVKHLAISSVPGAFGEFKGSFSFDPANISASKAEAEIETTSISTRDAKRDDHLRGGDFLDAQKFPSIGFKSSKIEKVSDTEFKAYGDLTIRGVTKPVVLEVTYGGAAKDPWGNERAAFVAKTKINRKDFGLTWSKTVETGALLVGEDVDITLEVEGVRA
jgi:polyisoprenoid-binding protein YceI